MTDFSIMRHDAVQPNGNRTKNVKEPAAEVDACSTVVKNPAVMPLLFPSQNKEAERDTGWDLTDLF